MCQRYVSMRSAVRMPVVRRGPRHQQTPPSAPGPAGCSHRGAVSRTSTSPAPSSSAPWSSLRRRTNTLSAASRWTPPTKGHLLKVCSERDDDWGNVVRTRIINEPSLGRSGAKYLRNCYSDLIKIERKYGLAASPVSALSTPSPPPPAAKRPRKASGTFTCSPLLLSPPSVPMVQKALRPGRPSYADRLDAFNKMCEYLEATEECQFTLKELTDEMVKHTQAPYT